MAGVSPAADRLYVMPQISPHAIFVGALIAGFVAAIALRRRRVVRRAVVAAVIVGSWALYVQRVFSESDESNRRFEARVARGESYTREEFFADGVGNNVAALACGWIPATAGAVLGLACTFLIRRRAELRHNPPMQRTATASTGAVE